MIRWMIFSLCLLTLTTALPAKANDTYIMADGVEVMRSEGADTSFSTWIVEPIVPAAGIMGYASVSREYAEAYVGPALMLGPLRLGGGIGMEQNEHWLRGGLIASLETEPVTLFGIAEIGGSGAWATFEVVYHPSRVFGIGMMAISADGVGPRLEITPFGPSVMLQASLLGNIETGEETAIVGLRGTVD